MLVSGRRAVIKKEKLTAALLALVIMLQCFAAGALRAGAEGEIYVVITGNNVNVRSDAGIGGSVLGSAPNGARFMYISEEKAADGKVWYRIQYTQSREGWVTSQYSAKIDADYSEQQMIDTLAASSGVVGLQAAVIRNGTVTDTYVYGSAVRKGKKMTEDSKFRVASLSKVFVAMNVMKLSEEGVVDIDANIGEYWGASVPKAVTLKSLLSHTSTLGELSYSSSRAGTLSQIRNASNYGGGTVGSPEVWRYNNYAMGVCGSTAEVALGSVLDRYAHEKFLDGLGIDASFRSGNVKTRNYALAYYNGGGTGLSADAMKKQKLGAVGCNTACFAGGLTISARDYAKLIAILANDGAYDGKTYLSPQSVETIEEPLFLTGEHGGSFYQCMPLRYKTDLYGQSRLYYHTGNAYGILALASYNPDTRNGVVVVTSGALAARDKQGVYSICSTITKNLYSYLDGNKTSEAYAVTISSSLLNMKKGEEAALTASVEPADSSCAVEWTTSDPRIASVTADGKVRMVGHGTAVITASAGDAYAECKVTAAPELSFGMLGATIRVTEPYGMRFGVFVDKDAEYSDTDIIEYGTLMIPADKLGGGGLTLETPGVLRVPAENIYGEDGSRLIYTGVLTNIPASSLDTDIVGRGYIIYADGDGTPHYVYTESAVRNFMELARSAYDRYASKPMPSEEEQLLLRRLGAILGYGPVSGTDTR